MQWVGGRWQAMLQHSKYRQSMTVTCPAKLDLLHVAFYGVFPSLHTVGNPAPPLSLPRSFSLPLPERRLSSSWNIISFSFHVVLAIFANWIPTARWPGMVYTAGAGKRRRGRRNHLPPFPPLLCGNCEAHRNWIRIEKRSRRRRVANLLLLFCSPLWFVYPARISCIFFKDNCRANCNDSHYPWASLWERTVIFQIVQAKERQSIYSLSSRGNLGLRNVGLIFFGDFFDGVGEG